MMKTIAVTGKGTVSMRLIDADELKRNVLKWMPKDQSDYMDSAIPPLENLTVSMVMEIDDAPTVDAVPVVRCAVCRYFRCNMRGNGTLPNGVCVLLWRGGYDPMDFCSEGERKDGNSNGL